MAAHLTDAHARNAKPREKPYKKTDGNGLFLLVQPNGAKYWRYRFRIGGKENMFAVGEYPSMGLQQAREARDAARRLVKLGANPAHHRRAAVDATIDSAANTFAGIAREWIDQNRNHWTPYYTKQVNTVLRSDVLPSIGMLPIGMVTSAQLLTIVRRVEARGAETVAILIRQWCSAIFRFAISTLRAEADPATALKGAIRRPKVQHKQAMPREQIPQLVRLIDDSKSTLQVRLALKLLLLTFVRPGELRGAAWAEFDLDRGEWNIPAARMKMGAAHIVPLSTQAIDLLRQLQQTGLGRAQLFPNTRDPKRSMSPTTLNRALERMGYSGRFSAHGFRATASTLLNGMGYRPDVIERQLAHGERNKVRASYNHATYLPERIKMMQEWADFISAN